MGRESPFSPTQKQHIEALFPDLLQQPANEVTDWIQREAVHLLTLDPFKTIPSNGLTRLKRKLRNYYDRHPSCQCFSFAPTGIVLFELERQAVIATAATERATATKTSFSVAYAVCTQEMWQSLGAAEQAKFEAQARSLPRGIGSNQMGFTRTMRKTLTDLCRGGAVGPLEMMIFWAFRDPHGNLEHGTLDIHSSDDISDIASQSTAVIPRDPPGVPLFPDVDWANQTTTNLKNILAEYLNQLWDYFSADGSRLPWDSIAAEPNVYYDVSRFVLPVPLREPGLLTVAEAGPLAHYFATASDPFVFRGKLNTQPEEPGGSSGKSGAGSDSGQSLASDVGSISFVQDQLLTSVDKQVLSGPPARKKRKTENEEATLNKAPNFEASNLPEVKRERPRRVIAARPTVAELGRGSGNKPTYAYQLVNADNEVVGEVDKK
ncbi:hypothetical protein C8R46DRAFT_1033913 [Mycena filopes]|nr:hypothetical protein C8R46DRAFT_1033913 [Mycena filopes]